MTTSFTVSEIAGLGRIEIHGGAELAASAELDAALDELWSNDHVHTLLVADSGASVTVRLDLALARALAAPGGMPKALAQLVGAFDRTTAFAALLHVVRSACRCDRIPGVTDQGVAPLPLRRIGVIGAGTMGASIAHAYAAAGCRVLLKDVDPAALERAAAAIRLLASAAPDGREAAEKIVARVEPATDWSGFDDLDLVVESAPEVLELKKQLFAELGSICAPRTILASNTSSLSIAALATATVRPRKVVGHHFFHPVPDRPLMEIGRTAVTDVETLVTSIAAARLIGKTPIVVPDETGFLANRVPYPAWSEARLLVEEGASPERIDRIALATGQPIGPLHAVDMVGHDVAFLAGEVMREAIPRMQSVDPPAHAALLYATGRLGVKSGTGYYRYQPGDPTPLPDPELDEILAAARAERGIRARDDITDSEIIDRTVLPTVNHGADALADRIAGSPADIDVAMVIGYGSPAFFGGPMWLADRIGLGRVVERLRALEHRFGERFKPSPYLEELAGAGRGFYD